MNRDFYKPYIRCFYIKNKFLGTFYIFIRLIEQIQHVILRGYIMRHIISIILFTVILSVSVYAKEKKYDWKDYDGSCNYEYFIYNEAGLTEAQLAEVMKLKEEYQPRFHSLKQKIYLEKTKMNLEMSKKNSDPNVISNSMNLNVQYSKELQDLADEFLVKYNNIKNNK